MEPLYFILIALVVLGSGLVALVYFGFIRTRDPRTARKKRNNSQRPEEALQPAEPASLPVGTDVASPAPTKRPFDILRNGSPTDEPVPSAETVSSVEAAAAPSQPSPAATPETPQGPRPRILIATLLREEVTGKLIVKVGNREYTSPQELQSSTDQRKVEYAAADLQQWFGARLPDANKPAEPEEAPSNPRTMVEQINQILSRKILNLPQEKRAIRLVEGIDGDVRVYLGLKVYSLGDVPDEEVRRLIRESVSEWEART